MSGGGRAKGYVVHESSRIPVASSIMAGYPLPQATTMYPIRDS